MALYVTVFAGSGPVGGLFAGGTAQVAGPPAGLLLGSVLAAGVLALSAYKLLRLPPTPAHRPSPAAVMSPPRVIRA